MNLPDGEVATAPVETTVEGHITFTDPLVFGGQRIDRLRLDFRGGRVTSVEAGPATGFVETIVATDDGASRVGEYGIGVNRHIESWTQDLFFDEKIVGTTHIALGRAYPECGGMNQSAIHWDIVKDLRPGPSRAGGAVYVDGEVVLDGAELRVPDGGATTPGRDLSSRLPLRGTLQQRLDRSRAKCRARSLRRAHVQGGGRVGVA